MKRFNILKGCLTMAFIGAAYISGAQTQPLKFETGANGKANWYANYVGVQLDVVYPASVAGSKIYTTANDGTGASGDWGTVVTIPIINEPIAMPPQPDSTVPNGVNGVPGSMTGKVALIYRGDTYFGDKAYYAAHSGADACIIVNNVPGSPVGMAFASAAGIVASQINIPVYMISQSDGDALDVLYNEGVTIPRVTITPWGQNLTHDLGFVPQGTSGFHSYAMPYYEFSGSNNPDAYKNVDGAFIANYGTDPETNVALRSTLSWTPTGGSTSVVRTDSAKLIPAFTVADSIYTLYSTDAYDLHATGTGRFDLTYTLSADSADAFTGNNTATKSMYLTTNTYCKGSYDFTNNVPLCSIWYGPTSATETWGPYFYVNKGQHTVGNIIASYSSATTGVFNQGDNFTFYMFTWKDSVIHDGLVEAGELQMVGYTTYVPNGTTDSSGGNMTVPMGFLDQSVSPPAIDPIVLRDTTWYWVCAVLQNGTDAGYLGCDGSVDYYPRSYGRFHQRINATNDSTYIEPYGPIWGDDGANISTTDPATTYGNFPFDNIDIDSVTYSNQVGLVPNIAMQVTPWTTTVKPVATTLPFTMNVYPNPSAAAGVVNVDVTVDNSANTTVTYIVLDPLGRVVTKVSHYNVQSSDRLVIPTDRLSAGGYYVSVIVNGKNGTKKFEVIK